MSTGLTANQRAHMLGYLSGELEAVGSIDRDAWERALASAVRESGDVGRIET